MQSVDTVEQGINVLTKSFGLIDIVTVKTIQEVGSKILFISSGNWTNQSNPSPYPLFLMNVRVWVTLKNVSSLEHSISSLQPSPSTISTFEIPTLSNTSFPPPVSSLYNLSVEAQDSFLQILLNTIDDTSSLFDVQKIYFVNATLTSLAGVDALVLQFNLHLKTSSFCSLKTSTNHLSDFLNEKISNQTFMERDPFKNSPESPTLLKNSIFGNLFVAVSNAITIPSSSNYCKTTSSELQTSKNSLNAFSQLSSHPTVTLAYVFSFTLFFIISLAFVILSNREKLILFDKLFSGDNSSELIETTAVIDNSSTFSPVDDRSVAADSDISSLTTSVGSLQSDQNVTTFFREETYDTQINLPHPNYVNTRSDLARSRYSSSTHSGLMNFPTIQDQRNRFTQLQENHFELNSTNYPAHILWNTENFPTVSPNYFLDFQDQNSLVPSLFSPSLHLSHDSPTYLLHGGNFFSFQQVNNEEDFTTSHYQDIGMHTMEDS
jgi:hypothetical protein